MQGLDLIDSHQWSFGPLIGSDNPFFSLNTHTIINTWIAMAVIIILAFLARSLLAKKKSLGQHAVLSVAHFFIDTYNQSFSTFSLNILCFITTLFIFIATCNSLSTIIPWTEEPTTDLNTTLSLGILSFVYAQWIAIKYHGLKEYIQGYFQPFFVFLPLNLISKLSSIISISFRLFGNIFGGSIIIKLYTAAISGLFVFEVLGIVSGLNIVIALFFGIFEGFLQAFVFTMLTTTALALSFQGENH
jgi:F-type H+-transporting ATPase subunit a